MVYLRWEEEEDWRLLMEVARSLVVSGEGGTWGAAPLSCRVSLEGGCSLRCRSSLPRSRSMEEVGEEELSFWGGVLAEL